MLEILLNIVFNILSVIGNFIYNLYLAFIEFP